MIKNILLALRGNVTKSKDSDVTLTVKNLVHAKKEAAGILSTHTMDMNEDGVTDGIDIEIVRKRLLGL